ncbi:MAG: L-aspartate oxidase, partial [Opitutales bacterium]|nr:L-aspartate oxidase [Opitutales bacterium]
LEAVVIADKASKAVAEYIQGEKFEIVHLPLWHDGNVRDPDERVILRHNDEELARTMWDYVGIVRTNKRLKRALRRVDNLYREIDEYYWDFRVDPDLLELRNKTLVALLIIRSAMSRKESRGLHYTLDYPNKSETVRDTILKKSLLP